ncbi:MAG: Dolichyl-phosphate-mannose-protein mannosyltransferase [Chloroflexi bacterium ADurb.Bin325]|nr:MAG: Dolichyl-phosphate-mannose-protein mannosyltransferase [Chloroflexi bacterium ADurb.Bin325]
MHLARLVSVLAGLLLVLATYGLGRELWPARPEIALAGAAFVAFLPESLFVGGAVTNDMLAAALAAAALWWAAAGRSWPAALAVGVALGLGFLTKASAIAVWPAAGLTLLLVDGWRVQQPSRRLGRFILTAVIATVIAAPWLWRNWTLYGDPLGAPVVLGTIDRRTTPLDLAWLARGWFLSFWGKFGGAGHIPLPWPLYVLWGIIVAGAVAGGALRLGRRERGAHGDYAPKLAPDSVSESSGTSVANRNAVRWIVLAGAPLLVALSMLSYSQVALGTDQGRLLFPALAPIGLLVAAGLAAWLPPRRACWLAPALAGVMLLVALLALQFGVRQPFAPPLAAAAEVAAAAPVQVAVGPLELVAAAWQPDSGALTLYWRAEQPVEDDLRVILRAYGADGAMLWEWKRSPGAGRYSTDRWRGGQVIRDAYRIPAEALAALARAEATVYAFPDETPLGRADLPLPGAARAAGR